MSETPQQKIGNIQKQLSRLHQRVISIDVKMAQLEAQGMTNARPHWMRKDDHKPDQLELTHKINSDYYKQNNTRREYIGVKPDKIEDALARVQRYKQHNTLKQELRKLQEHIGAIERQIKNLEYVTQGKQARLFW